MLQRTKWLAISFLISAIASCADGRDLFAPYRPRGDEIRAMLAWPRLQGRADVAIVLGCPAEDDGTASLCELCRIKSAVRAYREGRAARLLFSGGAAHSHHVEADVMADLANRNGVPESKILREGRAMTTWQNLRFAKKLLEDHALETVLIISTSDHLPRAHRIASYYGFDDRKSDYLACDVDLQREPLWLEGEDRARTQKWIEAATGR